MKRALVIALIILCMTAALVVVKRAAAETGIAEESKTVRAKDEAGALMEAALYTRVEFFGAQALVPFPTAEARNRLAEVRERFPREPRVLLKLAELDEKLGRPDEAFLEMQTYALIEPDKATAFERLADFSHRRARFDTEAEALEQLLRVAPAAQRPAVLRRLVDLAHAQALKKYSTPAFYEQVIAQDPEAFEIIEEYLDQLIKERNLAEALRVLRQYKERFPERRTYLIKKEVSILDQLKQPREAEAVYQAAFDPFWPEELSDSFYQFLKDHDRFRAYGFELREAFRRDPVDFRTAVRLVHYSEAAYDTDPSVFVELEKARAARKVAWKPEELGTIARMLIRHGYGDAASRFLYTLYSQGGMVQGSEMRGRILYQLFELLSDADEERIALTKGDLKFYQDIAQADTHPGMLGGLLSLVLNDTDPAREFHDEEQEAVRHFNRAAAYRLFKAYEKEYPTSPELAQMYLDIVRLYTQAGETEVAHEALSDFEKRYADAPEYAAVALKLADAYHAMGKLDEERAEYQRIMDYLGKRRREGQPLMPSSRGSNQPGAQVLDISSEPTEVKPAPAAYALTSNPGITVPRAEKEASANNSYGSEAKYEDYLARPAPSAPQKSEEDESYDERSYREEHWRLLNRRASVDYATVLERYVSALAKDNRTSDILALYSAEIKKYPDEPALYEQMLQWLGQTNLVEEQLRVYREALKQFPTTLWRDRMARWLLRRERKQEFASFSQSLLENLDDEETEKYLAQFVSNDYNASTVFDVNLYLGLYSLAHERFPHDLRFVRGLLRFYDAHGRENDWRRLVAEYYFESQEIRDLFLQRLAKDGSLRGQLAQAREVCNRGARPGAQGAGLPLLPYKLFRADASVWLSNYEEAIDAYRELNRLYPNTPEFNERLVAFTRSLGQHNRTLLEEAGASAREFADAFPAAKEYRTRAGEIQAELGDYERAKSEWSQLVSLAPGEPGNYLETATLYWDYFQYEDALRTIKELRARLGNETLYAFQAGAILEARHETRAALAEYVKAIAVDETEDSEVSFETFQDQWRARHRLETLYKRPRVPAELDQAFQKERARRKGEAQELILAYAELLKEADEWKRAAALLRREVTRSNSQDFLVQANSLFKDASDAEGSRLSLSRLVRTARSPRYEISFRLRLAERYRASGQKEMAARTLSELVHKYPTNYGVLSEAAGSYRRLGRSAEVLSILRAGMLRGKGKYHYLFARRVAAQELSLGHTAAAEQVLRSLHDEDRLNTELFHELAAIYVRTGNREALRRSFRSTLEAVKGQEDLDMKELRMQVASLRKQMIEAFTQLRDYDAAIEQYIEIINRDPDDEEKLDQALAYAKRYGGTQKLLGYYQQTAQQAYKNYRWNVVLARIYETKGDLAEAVRNYRAAIDNQPEMPELYDALASAHVRAGNYDAALAALGKAGELSNDDPQYVRHTIEILEKAGRHREAEDARRKLPSEEPRKGTLEDQFALAASLRAQRGGEAAEKYRQAWSAFTAQPYEHDLQASEMTGYVQALRDEESLDQITARLWEMRERFARDAAQEGNLQAGMARRQLQAMDGALPEAVGRVAAEKGSGEELRALYVWLQARIEQNARAHNELDAAALSVLQNLSRRAGFGSLEERILLTRAEGARAAGNPSLYHEFLKRLVDFYSERGDYRRVLDLLEEEKKRDAARQDFDYAQLTAENARLVGDAARELEALRDYYEQARAKAASSNTPAQPDALVERYFEALYADGEDGRRELASRAAQGGGYQLQLINFLLRVKDRELAHAAIDATPLAPAWKLARNAEASLALRDFGAQNERYFTGALQYAPIGELIAQKPDASRQVTGDDWFRLAQKYGQWLYLTGDTGRRQQTRALLPAMIENRPHDAGEQSRLARWYLDQKDAGAARDHFLLALESAPEDRESMAGLGAAYFLLGERRRAGDLWANLIKGKEPSPEACELYLRTLSRYGLAAEARERLLPIVAERISGTETAGDDGDEMTSAGFEKLKPLINALSESFAAHAGEAEKNERLTSEAEAARAAFFRRMCEAAPEDMFLPQMLVRESLVGREHLGQFYQMLVERSAGLSSYESDYQYQEQLQKSWTAADVEEAFDHAQSFKVTEPESKRLTWQKEYLSYLLDRREAQVARRLMDQIETELAHRYARPFWLRLAAARLEVQAGQTAQALQALRHLVGIEVAQAINDVAPPDAVRLNEAAKMLRAEGREREAAALLEAAYARSLALEQYEPSYFVGLARANFTRGDKELGRRILQIMIALGDEETKPDALAQLAALPIVKAEAAAETQTGLPEELNHIKREQALELAAETASEFALYDAAADYRRELLAVSPDDETNRVELARLSDASGKHDEAVSQLAAIISDRNATRRARWQALWLSQELAGQDQALWNSLRERVRDARADREMTAALDALSLSASGRHDDALASLKGEAGEIPGPEMEYFKALLEKRAGHDEAAVKRFGGALFGAREAAAFQAFDFDEDEPLVQLVRLYLSLGQRRAALKLSERAPALTNEAAEPKSEAVGADEADDAGEADADKEDDSQEAASLALQQPVVDERHALLTLAARASERRAQTRLELLAQLSEAAEQIDDLNTALKLARVRLGLLAGRGAEREAAASRIERLLALQRARAAGREDELTVDQNLVAQR
jgi:tetratricopeptide (TPR) repeat protein